MNCKKIYKNKYDVENIITRRTDGVQNLYLIKWQGYPVKDCSWEPISHLSNVIGMVNEFDENFPRSINQKLLKEFYMELQKYQHKLFLQKKRYLKYKKKESAYPNKIIIPLDDYDFSLNINLEEEKSEDLPQVNFQDEIKDEDENKNKNINININIDKEEKDDNRCNRCNINNGGKLIKSSIFSHDCTCPFIKLFTSELLFIKYQ